MFGKIIGFDNSKMYVENNKGVADTNYIGYHVIFPENPMFKNLATLVKSGDTQQVETVVRNIAKEKGIDFDKEFNSFKQMFRR